MMRTEDDLRSVFDTIAAEVDDRDLGPVQRRSPSVRRRVLTVAVAAATAGVVAVGAVIAVQSTDRPPGIVAGPSPTAGTGRARPDPGQFRSDATLAELPQGAGRPEIVLLPDAVQSLVLEMPVAQSTDVLSCVLTVGQGAKAPGDLKETGSSTVGSFPAVIGRGDPLGVASEQDKPIRTHVRWQPAPDRWADSSCAGETGEVPTARRLGESLRLTGTPFRVPVTASSAPFGLTVKEVYRGAQAAGAPRIMITLSPAPDPSTTPAKGADPAADVYLQVQSLGEYLDSNGPLADSAQRLADLDGRPVWGHAASEPLEENRLMIVDGTTVLSLVSTGRSLDDLRTVAGSLSLAPDLGRESSWSGTAADLPW